MNEPTKAEKEEDFKILLESHWNNGPFTSEIIPYSGRYLDIAGAEMMMLDFILLDLADELGYEFIEFQNEEHWKLYQEDKEQIEEEGWIPYDGKGMPEGLAEKQVCICYFGDQEWLSRASCFSKGKQWSWHAFDNEYKESAVYAISFYKVKEESEEQKLVENPENDNV